VDQLWGYIILGSFLLTSACSTGNGLTGFAQVAPAARAYMAGSVILAMIFVRRRTCHAPWPCLQLTRRMTRLCWSSVQCQYLWIAVFAPGVQVSSISVPRMGGGSAAPRPTTVVDGQESTAAPTASEVSPAAGSDAGAGAPATNVRARALFAYKANPADPHEISLEKDEIVTILDRRGNWWKARKDDGTLGIVPSNYMEVI